MDEAADSSPGSDLPIFNIRAVKGSTELSIKLEVQVKRSHILDYFEGDMEKVTASS